MDEWPGGCYCHIVEINAVVLNHPVSFAADVTSESPQEQNMSLHFNESLSILGQIPVLLFIPFSLSPQPPPSAESLQQIMYIRVCVCEFEWVCGVAWYFVRTMVMLFHPSVSFRWWLMEQHKCSLIAVLCCATFLFVTICMCWQSIAQTLFSLFVSQHLFTLQIET